MREIMLDGGLAWTFTPLPDTLAECGIAPKGVLHVGGHNGEEINIYRECGFGKIVIVEPDPVNAAVIAHRYPDVELVQAAAAPQSGQATFYRNARTVGGGLNEDPAWPTTTTFQVETMPVHILQRAYPGCNVAVIDTQGTELEVLMTANLVTLDMVIIETRDDELDPEPAAPREATIEFMESMGWQALQQWVHGGSIYTDTVFTWK